MSITYVESSVLTPNTNRTSCAVPVPTGVVAGDIVMVAIVKENTAAITAPSGFTLKASNTTNATTQAAQFVFWKRLTGSDTGTYSFSWTGSCYAGGQAVAARGCVPTGDPFLSGSIVRTANNSGTSVSHSVTSALYGFGISFVSSWALSDRTWSTPSGGWTKQEQTTHAAIGTKPNMPVTTTGTVTWVGSGNDYYHMFLGVLSPPGVLVSAIIGGVKKPAFLYSIIGGVKKLSVSHAIIGGVKKQ